MTTLKFLLPEATVDKIIEDAKLTPYCHLEGYMRRFWVSKPDARGSHGVRVHNILRSDRDKHFHSHPWPYCTILLRGGYTETIPYYVDSTYVGELSNYYGPGSVLVRGREHFHKLTLDPGIETWSLFIFGERSLEDWGFLTDPEKKVVTHWREYLGYYGEQYGVDGVTFTEHKA